MIKEPDWVVADDSSKSVKVKRLIDSAVIPTYAHDGDSGFDLVAAEDVVVEPGATVKVRTGLAFEIPSGYEMQIRPRSGITSRTKLRVQLGTIDSGYRGEVSVIVDNIVINNSLSYVDRHMLLTVNEQFDSTIEQFMSASGPFVNSDFLTGSYIIKHGDRIAQGVIVPVVHASIIEVDELSDTERSDGGFGSSGA